MASAERTGRADAKADGVDRRTFVKGAVIGAAAGAAGAAGLATLGWSFGRPSPAPDPQLVRFAGAKVLQGSPANMGVPIVPIVVDPSGFVRGRSDDLRPYAYCLRASRWEGFDPEFQSDDVLRYAVPPEKLVRYTSDEARERYWYYDRLGDRIRAEDFDALPVGTGAGFTWRTSGDADMGDFFGVIIKLPRSAIDVDAESAGALQAALPEGHDLVAYDAACTHFCCVAGWHEEPSAETLGFWDTIFCSCHLARFDPRQVRTYEFRLREDGSVDRDPM